MVIFILTREGFMEMKSVIETALYAIWVGKDVLTSEELFDLRVKGINLTEFTYFIYVNSEEQVNTALVTINEHHPNERIWTEIIVSKSNY